MRLNLPSRKRYKTKQSYIEAIYKRNKSYIDSKMADPQDMPIEDRLSRKEQFIDLVQEYTQKETIKKLLGVERITAKQAVEAILRRRDFDTPYVEQARENFRNALRGTDTEQLLKKELGTDRLYTEKFVYDKEEKGYKYKGILIQVENSPKGRRGGTFKLTLPKT